MEPTILFAQCVLAMCAIHLISQSSEYIAKWWAKNRPKNMSAKKVIRDDWYVFFSCSDLYGKDPDKKIDQKRKSVETEKKPRRDTRPAARV